MKATLSNGQTVYVNWRYGTCEKELGTKKEVKTIEQDCTSCNVFQDKELIASATIHRYHKDLPNKALARKTTFTHAIAAFSREDKKLLWNEFLQTVKIK